MKVRVSDGLIFEVSNPRDEKIISCPQADEIAEANGFVYAERFVNYYKGRTLELDEKLKVKS